MLFSRYERYEKTRQVVAPGTAVNDLMPKATSQSESASLIDLSSFYPQQSASAAAAALPTITTQIQSLGSFIKFDKYKINKLT